MEIERKFVPSALPENLDSFPRVHMVQGYLNTAPVVRVRKENDDCYLTDAQKEMIGVVVSSYNCCSYCLTTHGDNLRGLWQNARKVDKLSQNYRALKDELSKVDFALCEYAWYVTAHPQEIDQTQIEKLRAVGLDDHQILEAAFVAGFFNYTNRWVSTIAPTVNPGHFKHNRDFEK